MVEWVPFAPTTNMQLCPVLLSHHTVSSCLLLLPRESDFSGRVQAPSHTLCLIGWSGFQFYYPSSQGAICLELCPRPSANMFNTVLWPFHGSGWLLLKLLSLDITPDFKVQNQEGVPLWAMLLRQSSVRRSQKLDQTLRSWIRLTATFLLPSPRVGCSYEKSLLWPETEILGTESTPF